MMAITTRSSINVKQFFLPDSFMLNLPYIYDLLFAKEIDLHRLYNIIFFLAMTMSSEFGRKVLWR